MKLGKSAVASMNEITEATANQMVLEGEISQDWSDAIVNAFKEVSSKGDTELLALLAISCIMVLDIPELHMFRNAIESMNTEIQEQNTIN